MAEKVIKLKSKRLIITPATDDEIKSLIDSQTNCDFKKAYSEVLEGCQKDPKNRLWYTLWNICLKDNPQEVVGSVYFKGPQKHGAVEIGYGTNEEYENCGYMTEALKQITQWAFNQKDVYIIYAETVTENKASQRVLEKLSFSEYGLENGGVRYKLEKPNSTWMSIYMLFGLSIGTSVGLSLGKMSIGMSLGMCFGLVVGYLLDQNEKNHRKSVTETENDNK